MAELEPESLENLLNKSTNPGNQQEDWEAIMRFCDQVNKELEGPQISIRLLAHKIQSPQSREALYALATLEACVKNCGRRFHQEIGKFRFLNELIKVVSPKYLGTHTSEAVKKKVIELMYAWSTGLPHEPKVGEAYSMLKRQGIVKEDPTYVDKTLEPPPPPRPRDTVFEDEEKSKMLARLLKSKHPEDLQAANRLIKNMVKQDMERMEQKSKRMQELETVTNNIQLLSDMLEHYAPETATSSELDVMKELYDNIEKRRPNLFRLASDADEKDQDAMSEILKVNDDVVKVMTQYKKIVEGKSEENGLDTFPDPHAKPAVPPANLSLLDLEFGATPAQPPANPSLNPLSSVDKGGDISLLDDPISNLGIADKPTSPVTASGGKRDYDELSDIFGSLSSTTATSTSSNDATLLSGLGPSGSGLLDLAPLPVSTPSLLSIGSNTTLASSDVGSVQWSSPPATTTGVFSNSSASQPQVVSGILNPVNQSASQSPAGTVPAKGAQAKNVPLSTGMDDLAELGKSLMQRSLADSGKVASPALLQSSPATKVPMNQMMRPPAPAVTPQEQSHVSASSPEISASPVAAEKSPAKSSAPEALTDVFVPLEAIQPGSHSPVNVYDKNNVKIMLHIAKNEPRADVCVMALSVISTNTNPLKGFTFQAAVPKNMKVKLQPATGSDLPAFNPILPPSAITQIMLIANPQKEKIRLKYRAAFNLGGIDIEDSGELENFPIP